MLFLSATAYPPTPRLPRVPLKLSAFTRTPSGLEFEDIVVGDGRQPSVGDFVGVAYEGSYEGKVFESSEGNAISFPLGKGKVIKGWDEGLSDMRVGGKRNLRVPSQLAYEDKGVDGKFPGGATLDFRIELVSIDSSNVAITLLARSFQLIIGVLALNAAYIAATGHELRELFL